MMDGVQSENSPSEKVSSRTKLQGVRFKKNFVQFLFSFLLN